MGKEGDKQVGRSMEVLATVISTICGIAVHGLNFYSNSIFLDPSLVVCDNVL
jgi:hypothetical protein